MGLFKKKKRKKNRKESDLLTVNQQVFSTISKEIRVATNRYVSSVKRSNLFKSSALYGNPWFMILGPEGSGKSSLIKGSGLNVPLKYPEDKDGETASGINWKFGNQAVWLDVPGKLLNRDSEDTFKAVYKSLMECRKEHSVDGIICAVDINDILNGDQENVKELAGSLRAKIDELIYFWGIELPVYVVFTKTDTVTGFYEFFKDSSVNWADQVLGATLSREQLTASPRIMFQQEYELLCNNLKALRLKLLSKAKKDEFRRLICRFVIQFEGLQSKAGDFFAELFKESEFEGKPVFKGFYFTSCKKLEMKTDKSEKEPAPSYDISNTILNHPLNPHRAANSEGDKQPSFKEVAKSKINPFFTSRLFNSIFPNGTEVLQRTHTFTRKGLIKYWSFATLFTALFVLISWYLISSFSNVLSHNENTHAQIKELMKDPQNRLEAYENLGKLGDLFETYKRYERGRIPLSFGIGFYDPTEKYDLIKDLYFTRVREYLIIPTASYLEHAIQRYSGGYGDLSAEEYSVLYRHLKSYLCMSESIAQYPDRIDTVLIREIAENGLINAILRSERLERLPANVERAIRSNFSAYCRYLKKGEMPFLQENSNLVARARRRLSRVPDARTMYESIRNQLRSSAPDFSLSDMLGSGAEGILTAQKNMSMIYTQEGWDRFVKDEVNAVTEDPFRVDWVLGSSVSEGSVPAFDRDQMRAEITQLYLNDVLNQWLDFLRFTSLEPTGDMLRSGTTLQKLSAQRGELNLLFDNFLKLTDIDVTPDENVATGALKKVAEKKGGRLAEGVRSRSGGLFSSDDPAQQLKSSIDPIRRFAQSQDRHGGLSAYQERLSVLAESILRVARSGEVTNVFDGSEQDPLLGAWRHTQNLLASMPQSVEQTLEPLLLQPLKYTGDALSTSISQEIDQKWQSEVASTFNTITGKYPFVTTDNKADFDIVMEFFRPNTGTIWGFFNRHLSPYIIKEGSGFKTRDIGALSISFKEEFFEKLQEAEQIGRVFFNADGTLRVHNIMMQPVSQNQYDAVLQIGSREYELNPTSSRVRFQWPPRDANDDFGLRIKVSNNYIDDIRYDGRWGLLKLFEAARINVVNHNRFTANWNRNVQNMLMIQFGVNVQVSGSPHPFNERVFAGFICPEKIIKTEDR
ncbi:type VI secretion system membrane subunit TssM [Chitinispirillales bacterium ANBcel5]|uniref:type VI secretion system membrane subunit TssM n=1 Tax=Cellulosispirillum alkaliphilum TaxID=3039283 RepID=UPI002A56FFD5|nr:type VI secretion system membrane subunit TssM [Chitinispirillales bacterium ANBcel5]